MTFLMKRGPGYRTLRVEMDRVFDDFFGSTPAKREEGGQLWAPAVDIREDERNFVVVADLPGMAKDDIQVEVEQSLLAIKGERRFERKDNGENFHFVERSYGSFFRSFSLPKNVDADAIKADYKDGVLTLTLPKKEEAKPKKVEIGS